MLALLLACADDPPATTAATRTPTLDTSSPFVPELVNDYDPRLAGCTVTGNAAEVATWTYDDSGHLLSTTTTGDEFGAPFTTVEHWQWDGDCVVGTTSAKDWAGEVDNTSLARTCDAHGNVVESIWTGDDGETLTTTWDNHYDGSFVVGREGESDDGWAWVQAFVWTDTFVTEVRDEWIEGDLGVVLSSTYGIDATGQLTQSDTEVCATVGAEECVAASFAHYTMDADGRAISGEGDGAGWVCDEAGECSASSDPYTVTFTTGDGEFPAAATYVNDGDEETITYEINCG